MCYLSSISDYFADTLHFSSQEHAIFGALLLHLWFDATAIEAQTAIAKELSWDQWHEVRETVLPLFQVAAENIGDWKKALNIYHGKRLPPAEWYLVRTIILIRDSRICTYCGADNASQ